MILYSQPDCKLVDYTYKCALVAELVDAADSKSVVRKDVGVRFSPRAPHNHLSLGGFTRSLKRLQKSPTQETSLENLLSFRRLEFDSPPRAPKILIIYFINYKIVLPISNIIKF
jgi:hypothetical protein